MKFNADEIASVLQQEIEQYESQLDVREVGTVLEVGDGIARVYGLAGVKAGEMVELPGKIKGMALNLEEDNVGIVIFGNDPIGDESKRQSLSRILGIGVSGSLILCCGGKFWYRSSHSFLAVKILSY